VAAGAAQVPRTRDFSEGESTFHSDGVDERPEFPERLANDDRYVPSSGKEGTEVVMPTAKPHEWFQETESAGAKRAWQSYYPAMENFRSRAAQNLAPWREGASGGFQESYVPDEKLHEYYTMTKAKDPAWFDNSVSQYDAFGRGKLPRKNSKQRYIEFSEQSRNTTMACKNAGCEVTATLQVFDQATEHADCKLSLLVHPTDFDDEYSREYVELVQLNGKQFNFHCHPEAPTRTCGASGDDALMPCLKDLSLDGILKRDGKLNITARISRMVDECPVNGNLFSGVAVVKCLVHPSWDNTQIPTRTDIWRRPTPPPPRRGSRLRCKEPGCTASTTVLLSEKDTRNKTCRLTVRVAQTDFDGDLGSKEEIEWVRIGENITKAHVKPGRNPCKEQFTGQQGSTAGSNSTDDTGSNASSNSGSSSSNSSASGKKDSSNNTDVGGKANGGAASSKKTSKPAGKAAGKAAGLQVGDAGFANELGSMAEDRPSAGGKAGSSSAGKDGSSAGNASSSAGSASSASSTAGDAVGSADGASSSAGDASSSGGRASSSTGNASSSAGSTGKTDGSAVSASPGVGGAGGSAGGVARNATTANSSASDANRSIVGVFTPDGGGDASQNISSDPGAGGSAAAFAPSAITNIFGAAGVGVGDGGATVASVYGDLWDDDNDTVWYTLLNGTDVTAEAQDGKVSVSAKISGMVDECGRNGFLLDGKVVIECS